MHRHNFHPLASASAQRCYYFVVRICTFFVVHMYNFRGRRPIVNAAALATGRALAHIPIILNPSLAHGHSMSVVGQRARAARQHQRTIVYLVRYIQQRPTFSCFSEARPAYHVPASVSLPSDTVDGATTETRGINGRSQRR